LRARRGRRVTARISVMHTFEIVGLVMLALGFGAMMSGGHHVRH
jgi:hypothetical protein